jgi:hypothetical protein
MSARTHLAIRLAAIAVIALASMVPRGGTTPTKVPLASLVAPAKVGPTLARR